MTLPSFGQQALRASHWTRRGIVGLILRLGFFLALLPGLNARQAEPVFGIEGGWRWGYVDTQGSVGTYNAIAIDGADFPHISYYDQTQGDLKYAFQDATGWHVEVVDSTGDVGEYTSIELDNAGFPHISYYDRGNGDLKVAAQGPTGWHTTVVDSTGDVGQYSSLALDSAGYAHVAYFDATNADLKMATQDAAGWHIAVVDRAGNVGQQASLDLDSHGTPFLAYADFSNNTLKLARGQSGGWQFELVDGISGGAGPLPSLAINPQDEALIGYRSANAVYLARRTASGWRFETIAQDFVDSLAMALNPQGQPRLFLRGNEASYEYRDDAGWHRAAAPLECCFDFSSLGVDSQDRPQLAGDGLNINGASRALMIYTTPNYLNSGHWVTQRAGTPSATFRFVDADHGWATSPYLDGAIYRTSNGGATWDQVRLGGYGDRYRVSDMVFLDDQVGWATGDWQGVDIYHRGMFIVHTRDGGRTWTHQISHGNGAGNDSQGVWFVNDHNGWVDADPYLWRTRDGGETWTRLEPSAKPYRVLRFADIDTGFGLNGVEGSPWAPPYTLMRTGDGGVSWSPVELVPEWQQAIWISDDGTTLWVVGVAGQIARSIDGGYTWSPIASPTSETSDKRELCRSAPWLGCRRQRHASALHRRRTNLAPGRSRHGRGNHTVGVSRLERGMDLCRGAAANPGRRRALECTARRLGHGARIYAHGVSDDGLDRRQLFQPAEDH